MVKSTSKTKNFSLERQCEACKKQHTIVGFFAGGLAAGGFGVGSDSFYDLSANIGCQWSKAVGTTFGYCLFDVDYNQGDFLMMLNGKAGCWA